MAKLPQHHSCILLKLFRSSDDFILRSGKTRVVVGERQLERLR